ncbi:ATP-binding protein [Pontibacter sp. Tf4]|nr:ATP-binding protein [Pontibacter sp. Tf4]MBB6611779.1 ATP-binding protein [Pontibacter sp. Tf4]
MTENKTDHACYENADPDPEYLIKSIAEQGYSLETSLTDLMDNSVSAGADRIEVLIRMDQEPFTLFLADNGSGMDRETLRQSMHFPSSSPESNRKVSDLGRFGLGMKTASFAQTRCFTVLSRKKGGSAYHGRTWDVDYLKQKKKWRILINTEEEITALLASYQSLSSGYQNSFEKFEANTIIVWKGLYKFEDYLEETNRQDSLKKEITEVTSDYLSLVFHRFMERKANPLRIRINNTVIKPFNPFPIHETDVRPIEYRHRNFRTDTIKIEGFVLPSRSIDESKQGLTQWTTRNRGLMDMEGMYIYRADRIILFGGWNGIIKKSPKLQLARLRVEVGNSVDHLLHLNVAKSQIVIPYELRQAFLRYISILKGEAEKEFFNRGIRKFSGQKKAGSIQLFERRSSSKGVVLELNADFPILKELRNELTGNQLSKLNWILRMITTSINKIRHVHEDVAYNSTGEEDGLSADSIISGIVLLRENGMTPEQIKKDILPSLGFSEASLPEEIKQLLKTDLHGYQ